MFARRVPLDCSIRTFLESLAGCLPLLDSGGSFTSEVYGYRSLNATNAAATFSGCDIPRRARVFVGA